MAHACQPFRSMSEWQTTREAKRRSSNRSKVVGSAILLIYLACMLSLFSFGTELGSFTL